MYNSCALIMLMIKFEKNCTQSENDLFEYNLHTYLNNIILTDVHVKYASDFSKYNS